MERRTTILIVEENAAVRDALGRALERENFQVVPAATGGDALSEKSAYDVALIDVNHWHRNGFDTFYKLNALHPFLPIILMSSHPEILNHPVAAKASARMLKPLEMPLLCRTVRDLAESAIEGSNV